MGSEWITTSLASVSQDISYGYTASAKLDEVGPRFLRITDIQGGTVNWDSVPFCVIPDSQTEKYLLEFGDIVVARTGNSTGENYFFRSADKPVVFASYLIRFRINSSIANPQFVWYTMRSQNWWAFIQGVKSGSAQAGANAKVLGSFRLNLPPLPEQRAIAHILGTLDDKIELNRKINETLEAMAQALFKSWFVDFDPVVVNALRADNPIPEKFAARAAHYRANPDALGLSDDILRLFPARFVDSELGPIPEGWEVRPFATTVEIIGGGTPKTSVAEYWNGDIPWFSIVDAPGEHQVWVIDTEKKITRAGMESSSTRILSVGTTIISARGTVGRVALVGVPMAMNQSCYGLRGRCGTHGFFNYFATRQLVSILKQSTHGSVFDTITRATFAAVDISMPPPPVVEAFEERVNPILDRIRQSLIESRTLAALRDTLLPKLISGELRVKDAEGFVGRVYQTPTEATS